MTLTGVTAAAFENTVYVESFKETVASSIDGVSSDDVYNVVALDVQLNSTDDDSRRQLSTSGVAVDYDIVVIASDFTDHSVSDFLDLVVAEQTTAIDSGDFATTLEQNVAATNDTAALVHAQATVPQAIEASVSTTLAPSSSPTPVPTPVDSGSSKKSSSSGEDMLSIMLPVLVAALLAFIFTAFRTIRKHRTRARVAATNDPSPFK